MKKKNRLFYFMTVITLVFLSLPSLMVQAEDFPVQGFYANESQEAAIEGIDFGEGVITLLMKSPLEDGVSREDYQDFLDFKSDQWIHPDMSAEDIAKKREEIGLPASVKDTLQEILDDLDDEATLEDFQDQVDQQIPSLHYSHPFDGDFHVVLAAPQVQLVEDEYIVKVLGERLLAFEIDDQGKLVFDDGQIFQLQESEE